MGFVKNILMLLNREIPTNILIKRGMKVGKNFSRQQGCFLDPTHCYLIEIGDDVTMSIRVTLMAHDASMKRKTEYARLGRIVIGDRVFIGANATILPGVSIGDDAIVGAGSVVTRDIPPGMIAAGVPARVIGSTDDLACRVFSEMKCGKNVFDASYRMGNGLTEDKMVKLIEATNEGYIYID